MQPLKGRGEFEFKVMQFTIDKPSLAKALAHVASVVERRNTIPILSNVHLATRNNELKLTSTDLDMEIVETVPCRSKGEGSTTVPAHMFHDIVRKLPEGNDIEVVRDGDQGRLAISCGRARFALQTLPADDFPSLSVDDLGHAFTMPAADLKRLIDKTRFAISTEETRYYLNGIYLHAAESDGKETLRAVATDGHRLAQVELPLPSGAKGMPGVIVPRKTVAELAKLVEDGDGEVRVELSPSKIRVTTARVVLTSKLIDGTFPDYERVIPQGNDKKMEVDNHTFAEAVDRVSTLSSDKGRAVKLSIQDGKLVLSVHNPDSGSASEEIPVEYGFDPLEIGFNARYLLDISGQLEGGTAEFQLADPGSPTMIRDGEDSSALYVLMPMRV
jgi:DNA polymerase-3 subunit beta